MWQVWQTENNEFALILFLGLGICAVTWMPEVDIWGPLLLSTSLGSWLLASTLLRQHFLFFIRLQISGELVWGHLDDSPVLSDVYIWLVCCREQTRIVKFAWLALCPAEPSSLLYFIGRISHQLARLAGKRALEILLSVLPGACHHNAALNSGPYNELTKMTRIHISRHLACENRCVCKSRYSCTYSYQTATGQFWSSSDSRKMGKQSGISTMTLIPLVQEDPEKLPHHVLLIIY